MPAEDFLRLLGEFYRAARHLWGRCPSCGDLFRVSDAAIQHGDQPPRDWLERLQREQNKIRERLHAKEADLDQFQAELEQDDADVRARERMVEDRERNVERHARARAIAIAKDGSQLKALLRDARQDAVSRSRSTLLGNVFERLAPFLQRFNHDPRDVRPLMNPIDYVCFDGLTQDRRVERITFVEVKAGTSRASPAQQSIVEAVRAGRVNLEVWKFGEKGIPLAQQLSLVEGARGTPPRSNGAPRDRGANGHTG